MLLLLATKPRSTFWWDLALNNLNSCSPDCETVIDLPDKLPRLLFKIKRQISPKMTRKLIARVYPSDFTIEADKSESLELQRVPRTSLADVLIYIVAIGLVTTWLVCFLEEPTGMLVKSPLPENKRHII